MDWLRNRPRLLSLLRGSGKDNTSHIPFLIMFSQNWSLYYLMVIFVFPYLRTPFKLIEPEHLYHVFYIINLFLRAFKHCPLWIGTHHFLNFLLYWYPETIQSLSFPEQVKQFVLAYGYVPEEGTIEPSSSLYNIKHSGTSTLKLSLSTKYDHLTMPIVLLNVAPSGDIFLIVVPSVT